MKTYTVKHGLHTYDKPMTTAQAKRLGDRSMPADLKRAGFRTEVAICDLYPDLGEWVRISYCKQY